MTDILTYTIKIINYWKQPFNLSLLLCLFLAAYAHYRIAKLTGIVERIRVK